MSDTIIPFTYASKPVRVVDQEGEAWFSLLDLAEILGLSNPTRAASRLSADEVATLPVQTPGGMQSMRMVSEPGMYRLVFTSRSKGAEQFKQWISHEVLPAIRSTGMYLTDDAKADIAISAYTLACQLDDIDRYAGTHPGAVRAKTDAIRTAQLQTLRSMCGKDAYALERSRHRADPA